MHGQTPAKRRRKEGQKSLETSDDTVDCEDKGWELSKIEELKCLYPPLLDHDIQSSWPDIHYKQEKNGDLCVFLSMASALHFMGELMKKPILKRIASNINAHATEAVMKLWSTEERVKCLMKIMSGTFTTGTKEQKVIGLPALLERMGVFKSSEFDPLNTKQQKRLPTLAICESVDFSSTHAVTFFGSYVFDCNETKALKILPASLHRCVPYGFKRVVRAYRFGKALLSRKTEENGDPV